MHAGRDSCIVVSYSIVIAWTFAARFRSEIHNEIKLVEAAPIGQHLAHVSGEALAHEVKVAVGELKTARLAQ
jgi:hypothetical protein